MNFSRIVTGQEWGKACVLAIGEFGLAGIEALDDLNLHWDGSALLFQK